MANMAQQLNDYFRWMYITEVTLPWIRLKVIYEVKVSD